jgi:hypothetical protein
MLSDVIEYHGMPKTAGGSTVEYLLEIALNDGGLFLTDICGIISYCIAINSAENCRSFYRNSHFAS